MRGMISRELLKSKLEMHITRLHKVSIVAIGLTEMAEKSRHSKIKRSGRDSYHIKL